MNREELEVLDRDSLINRAETLGVNRAGVLTRPELVDEILLRAMGNGRSDPKVRAARGLFGRARDLLVHVMDRGLHLPEAAEIFRGRAVPSRPMSPSAAVPTVTLAEIYAAQGHKERAVETLRRVIESEPDHAAAGALLAQIEAADLPPPALPPEEDELVDASSPVGGGPTQGSGGDGGGDDPNKPFLLDDEPLPPKYDVDECVALPVDPNTMFVYWELRDATRAHFEATRPGGQITLRAMVIVPTWDGPRVETRDFVVTTQLGDFFVRDLPRGSVIRAAIGWRVGDAFIPAAHSPALETLASEPSAVLADRLVRWTPEGKTLLLADGEQWPGLQRALGVAGARLRSYGRTGGGKYGAATRTGAGVSSMEYERGAGVTSPGVSSFG